MRHAFCFYGRSFSRWRDYCFTLHRRVWYQAPSLKRWKTWSAWAKIPNRESDSGCRQQPTSPPTALQRALVIHDTAWTLTATCHMKTEEAPMKPPCVYFQTAPWSDVHGPFSKRLPQCNEIYPDSSLLTFRIEVQYGLWTRRRKMFRRSCTEFVYIVRKEWYETRNRIAVPFWGRS